MLVIHNHGLVLSPPWRRFDVHLFVRMHAPDQTKSTASTSPLRIRPWQPWAADHLTPPDRPAFHPLLWAAGPFGQSWNRYSYGQDDPVNSSDWTGLDLFGDDPECWFWDDGCEGGWEDSGGGLVQPIILGGGVSVTPTRPIITAESFLANALGVKLPGPGSNVMNTWALLMAAGIASNQLRASSAASAGKNFEYPTMLLAVGDSCTVGSMPGDPLLPTPNAVRRITYEVLDQNGNPWNGNDGPLSVSEIVNQTAGNAVIVAGGVWTLGAQDGIDPANGTFTDYLSVGTLSQSAWADANQVFYGTGAFAPQALNIQQMYGQASPFNSIAYAHLTVNVNGLSSPSGCK